eukprot:jgi/Picsp_1/2646/NSC_00876-R1_gtpase activator nb4s evi5 (contains tbc domain) calmodulin-binding protein pollux (contains ptb and tbc domains)
MDQVAEMEKTGSGDQTTCTETAKEAGPRTSEGDLPEAENGDSDDSRESSEDKNVSPGFSLRLAAAASGLGGTIYRSAAAAGAIFGDRGLRKRSADVISTNASKGIQGIQYGFQLGANSVQKGFETLVGGPKQIQAILTRLGKQYEEQRMLALLEEQRDAPMDIQIGFSLYEDAPQDLRSRLWVALLNQSKLVEDFELCKAPTRVNRHVESGDEDTAAENLEQCHKNDAISHILEGTIELPSESLLRDMDAEIEPASDVSNVEQSHGINDVHDDWEVMDDRGTSKWRQGGEITQLGRYHRIEPWNEMKEAFRQELMVAITSIEWPLQLEVDEGGRYSTLLQISVGQEEIDDIIYRDIHRTFPEYPLFGFEQGQKSLFNVLKAYSLHDLEVGYCQGMAFVAGLLLFFVPEEVAFRLFCKLMDEEGINLRRFYLPGLVGLKIELERFDILMQNYLPNLKHHLESQGAVSVLYASQWFLSLFSCPFPVPFCSRLLDVMFLQGSDSILQRVSISIMAEFEAELMMQDDFEELLTYLKVAPLRWDHIRLQKVINSSTNSPISDAELKDAEVKARKIVEDNENDRSLHSTDKSKKIETTSQSVSLDDSSKANSSTASSAHSLSEEEEEGVESTISRQQTDMNSEYEKMIEELEATYFQADSLNN